MAVSLSQPTLDAIVEDCKANGCKILDACNENLDAIKTDLAPHHKSLQAAGAFNLGGLLTILLPILEQIVSALIAGGVLTPGQIPPDQTLAQ